MDGFNWRLDDGTEVRVIFSLIRDAYWLNDKKATVVATYEMEPGDEDNLTVMRIDLEDEDGELTEYGREVWNMLLQVTNLDAT